MINLFITLLASEGLTLLVSYIFGHMLVSMVITSLILGIFMILNGFFIKFTDIPKAWIWMHYIAFNTYTF